MYTVNENVAEALGVPGARSASDTVKATADTEESAGWSHTSSTCVFRPGTCTGSVHRLGEAVVHPADDSWLKLDPQQMRAPLFRRAQVWSRPATMAAMLLRVVEQVQVHVEEVAVQELVATHTS